MIKTTDGWMPSSVGFTFVIILVLACVLPGIARTASAATQQVSFSVSDQSNHLTATFATNVVWDEALSVEKGSQVDLSYTLGSAPGTLRVTVPLSKITVPDPIWGTPISLGLADQAITIPLQVMPIGSYSVPIGGIVSSVLGVPLPSEIASVDLIAQASVKVAEMECSAGQDKIMTPLSSLEWTSWGTGTATIDADIDGSSSTVSIRTTLAYGLSYRMTATVLGSSFSLIPTKTLTAVNGSPSLETSIQLGGGFPVL